MSFDQPSYGPKVESEIADRYAAESIAHGLVDEIPSNELIDVESILQKQPELRKFPNAVVVLIYEQYQRLADTGEYVDKDEIVAAYPDYAESLVRMFEAEEGMLRAAPVKWPQAGERFLGFELIEEIGKGAFSRVFIARDQSCGDRSIVVKVCRLGRKEAEALGKLQHPQVVRILSVRHDRLGLSAIAMPYVSRTTLLDLLSYVTERDSFPSQGSTVRDFIVAANSTDDRIEPADDRAREATSRTSYIDCILDYGLQIAKALKYSHEKKIFHCDLKPSNVLLTRAGGALLFDFNLASKQEAELQNIGGTLPYMSPEQLRAVASSDEEHLLDVDARSDLFSFGVLLFELLTGSQPFGQIPNEQSREVVAQEMLHRQQLGPTPPEALNLLLNPTVCRLLKQCLEFEPARRLQSAAELIEQLKLELTRSRRAQRWLIGRRKFVYAGLVGVSLSLLALGAYEVTRESTRDRHSRLGTEAFFAERYDSAVTHFTKACEADEGNAELHFCLGRAHIKAGNFEDAEEAFIRTNRLLPKTDWRVIACFGHSVACGTFATRKFPQLESERLEAILRRKRYLFAIARYLEAINIGAPEAVLRNNMGFCYRKLKHSGEGNREFRIAAKQPHCPWQSYFFLALDNYEATLKKGEELDLELIDEAIARGGDLDIVHFHAVKILAEALKRLQDPTDKSKCKAKIVNHCRQLDQHDVVVLSAELQLLQTLKGIPLPKDFSERQGTNLITTFQLSDFSGLIDPLGDQLYLQQPDRAP